MRDLRESHDEGPEVAQLSLHALTEVSATKDVNQKGKQKEMAIKSYQNRIDENANIITTTLQHQNHKNSRNVQIKHSSNSLNPAATMELLGNGLDLGVPGAGNHASKADEAKRHHAAARMTFQPQREDNDTSSRRRRKANFSHLELPNGRNSLFEINPLASNIGSNMHSKGHSYSMEQNNHSKGCVQSQQDADMECGTTQRINENDF